MPIIFPPKTNDITSFVNELKSDAKELVLIPQLHLQESLGREAVYMNPEKLERIVSKISYTLGKTFGKITETKRAFGLEKKDKKKKALQKDITRLYASYASLFAYKSTLRTTLLNHHADYFTDDQKLRLRLSAIGDFKTSAEQYPKNYYLFFNDRELVTTFEFFQRIASLESFKELKKIPNLHTDYQETVFKDNNKLIIAHEETWYNVMSAFNIVDRKAKKKENVHEDFLPTTKIEHYAENLALAFVHTSNYLFDCATPRKKMKLVQAQQIMAKKALPLINRQSEGRYLLEEIYGKIKKGYHMGLL